MEDTKREFGIGMFIHRFTSLRIFVDGHKGRLWRQGNYREQERAYEIYKKAHVWSVVVYCDLFGRFFRLEISGKGAESDRDL